MNKRILASTLLAAVTLGTINSSAANKISPDQEQWIEVYKNQKFVPAPEDMLINKNPEPNLKKGFVDLYNGKNLDGWTVRGGNCTFEAVDDTIVGTCVKGSPSTYLSTDKEDYTNFIFTAELKWEVDGNTGIIFRGDTKPGDKYETVFGPQAEMEDEGKQRFWSGGIYGQGCGGWMYPLCLDAHEEARNAINYRGWNRITIKANGDTVRTWVNGVAAALWKTDEYMKGFFSLQVHSGDQGKIHFRNIKVKELAAKPKGEDLFSSGDFSKWTHPNGQPVSGGWKIENGVIHRFEKHAGGLNTKANYKDFKLRFDWKVSEGGNSGVKYRAHGGLGLEYQVLDDAKHKDGKIPTHRTADLYDLLAAPDDKPVKAVGKWNRGLIIAKGNHIEHWLNGTKVLEIEYGSEDWNTRFEKSKYSKHEDFGNWTGSIHLQDHGDEVWYRNVHIQEL